MITRNEEKIVYPENLGLRWHENEELRGGRTVEESAKLFLDILEGKGTQAQEEVAIANAGIALYITGKYKGLEEAIYTAKESLKSGNALKSFKNFINTK